jgi:acetyltransferase-like isoleucine patch superfamily enzyme
LAGVVLIEDYSFITHEVVIADNAFASPPASVPARPARVRSGSDRNCWVRARDHSRGADIGEDAIIGAGAIVERLDQIAVELGGDFDPFDLTLLRSLARWCAVAGDAPEPCRMEYSR